MNKKIIQPPKWADKLLNWYCSDRFLEEVQGDLHEWFYKRVERQGGVKARLFYFLDVIRFFRIFRIKKIGSMSNQNLQLAMIKNYIIIGTRNSWKNKTISLINTLGLSLGFACSLLIFFHIKDELSYDEFFEKSENIYRVVNQRSRDSGISRDAGGPVPMGVALKSDFPEVLEAVRLWRSGPTITYKEKVFIEEDFLFVDQGFLKMFPFELVSGNPSKALELPNSILITESTAVKYFGDDDPMGKVFKYSGYPRGNDAFKVSGVVKDLPHNTHFKFDFLAPIVAVTQEIDNWGSFKPVWTYIALNKNSAPSLLEEKFPAFINKYIPQRLESDPQFKFVLEPFNDIYLHSIANRSMKSYGSITSLYIFGAIGLGILLIACINFINLTTARSITRFKEIGVRKSIGASKNQIMWQFLVEASIVVIISAAISILLLLKFFPLYNDFTGKGLNFNYLMDFNFGLIALTTLIFVVILSAGYPSIYLALINPAQVLKGNRKASKSRLRRGLVVLQFFISTILIIGAITVNKQLGYIQDKPIGISKQDILVVPYSNNEEVILNELLTNVNIENASISQRLPVNTLNYDGRWIGVEGNPDQMSVQSCVISPSFLSTYQIELIAGSNYTETKKDVWEFIINETAVKNFGWPSPEEAIGRKIIWSEKYEMVGNVIGVVKDFHLESLHKAIPSMVLFRNIEDNWGKSYISLKIKPGDYQSTIGFVERTWKKFNPGSAFFYLFIEDSYNDLHSKDIKLGEITRYFSFVAIIIACLGLLGLSLLTVNQRIKEIGLRKVLGASILNITIIISKDYLWLISIGLLLSVPLGYLFMSQWLDEFTYRTSLGLDIFILTAVITMLLAWITVGFQTVKAAMSNPVNSLRDE